MQFALSNMVLNCLFNMAIRCNIQEIDTFQKIYSTLRQLCCHWSSSLTALFLLVMHVAYTTGTHATALPKPLVLTKASTKLTFPYFNRDHSLKIRKAQQASDVTEIHPLHCWPRVGLVFETEQHKHSSVALLHCPEGLQCLYVSTHINKLRIWDKINFFSF